MPFVHPYIVRSLLGFGLAATIAQAQTKSIDTYRDWVNSRAQDYLQQRAQTIRGINSITEAEKRKVWVRQELLKDMGGLPETRTPLNARVVGRIRTDLFTIEKVIYESLPGFYVTANLYRPNAPGKFPAVLLQAGHTQEGKPENQRIAANLAAKGFVVLCFDPIGQGEREQTYSRQIDGVLAGWSVPEHILMDAQAQLIGQSLTRYFIWDAMRSIDYLTSRPEVDADRIGAAGCSGGGALTTFIGALDSRIKAVVPACYPASFQVLFPFGDPDGEMTFPRFLASGLDMADFVELAAPKPWLLEATEVDQYGFSHQGVEMVYHEAQSWYNLYQSPDKIGYLMGPGTHGMPLVSREAVYQWMIRWLKNGKGDYREQPVPMFSNGELLVTRSGHVEDERGSRKLHQVLGDQWRSLRLEEPHQTLQAKLKSLQIPSDRSVPAVKVLDERSDDGVVRQHIAIESEEGIWLEANLYLPASAGRKNAVVMICGEDSCHGPQQKKIAEQMVRAGHIVLEVQPRTTHAYSESGPYSGNWAANMHANLIGRCLPAMRAHDIVRAVDLLEARGDVDSKSIRGVATGVPGIWLLLAAAADPRLSAIWLDKTPYSLRAALDNSIAADLSDAVIPGFILEWDLQDLVKEMQRRPVLWTDPTNWMRGVVPLGDRYRYRYVLGDLTDEANAQDEAIVREFLN